MRNLTIRRDKAFAAAFVKMQVYIEDHTVFDLHINNIPCRKLGDLKNGQEVSFRINERAARVYIIADIVSREYCNDYYQLPEGEEDIHLSGKNKYSPSTGNAFRFYDNEREEVQLHRKKSKSIGILVLVCCAILGAIGGFVTGFEDAKQEATQPQIFRAEEMSITLPGAFEKVEQEGYLAAYGSSYSAVFVLKEPFSLAEGFGNYTLEEYMQLVLEVNQTNDPTIGNDNGIPYFEYTFLNTETGDTWHYFAYVYKTGDSFWLVSFAVLDSTVETYRSQISQWAHSVTFSN